MEIQEWQSRNMLLLGKANVEKLGGSHVLVAGLGGVGGYAAEMLCRAGIGELTLIDSDVVQASNRNRQLIALNDTENLPKADLFSERLKKINPDITLNLVTEFLQDENIDPVLEPSFDYVVDAIDTLTPKVNLLEKAYRKKLKIVSSMGAGGRLDPSLVNVADISRSNHCKFAYIVRKYLHRRGIFTGIDVVFSTESVPKSAMLTTNGENNKRSVVGTVSFMPAIFGCYCASAVVNGLITKLGAGN
jgi:tRNA threonylcarbamoyladenosine dehydratase